MLRAFTALAAVELASALNECLRNPCGAEQRCEDRSVTTRGDFICRCLQSATSNIGAPARCPVDSVPPSTGVVNFAPGDSKGWHMYYLAMFVIVLLLLAIGASYTMRRLAAARQNTWHRHSEAEEEGVEMDIEHEECINGVQVMSRVDADGEKYPVSYFDEERRMWLPWESVPSPVDSDRSDL
eukprot:Rhum_TRINITY_DN6583_c0_g1::Rhum_TRINITY_DN6583_c0_g1_i1::g.20479::m.20479